MRTPQGPQRASPGAKCRRQVRGFSLIEVMVATALLAVAALVAFPTILSFFDLSDMAREENIATHDLMAAVEEVMATPFASVTTSYPPGQAIPKYANLHLRGEQVMVNYTDPNQDPLEVVLTATWLDRRGRTRQEAFRCMRTR